MLMSLPNISVAGSLTPTKLPRLLLIFLTPSTPSRSGMVIYLLRLVLLLLEIAPHQNIEQLIGAAELDIRFHHHRIPTLHYRILNLMRMNGLLLVDSRPEILALQ